VPEFLTLLHGVLDSPDIPLNVSRSYLQSDSNVKKISSHITKKLADRLAEIFKDKREDFQNKWDDLKLFIGYGMISDEKFYERAEKFALLKNTDQEFFTFDEYKKKIEENQTDKNKQLIYLYATHKEEHYSYIKAAKEKSYDVLLLDGQLDMHFINTLESKFKDSRFVRVDSDIIDNLIQKEQKIESVLNEKEQENIKWAFQGIIPEQKSYWVTSDSMSENDMPVVITRDEYMRRMKDMSVLSGGTNFYRDLPDDYKVIINTNHPLIVDLSGKLEKKTLQQRLDFDARIEELKKAKSELEKSLEKFKKEEEKPVEEKEKLEDLNKKLSSLEEEKTGIYKEFGKKQKLISQLFDLALLANNLLKGESLSTFVSRSVELLKK